jgi:hypothetical protein
VPWSKLDDQFYDHPKTVAVGTLGAGLFALALSWTAKALTDGFVPAAMIPRLVADIEDPIALADALVDAGMFEAVKGGYLIHDYLKYNPPAAKVKAKREEDARRQAEWRERNTGSDGQYHGATPEPEREPNAVTNSVTEQQVTTAPFPFPYPSPSPVPVPEEMGNAAHDAPTADAVADEPPPPPASPRKRRARKPESAPDERTAHPAIQCVRGILGGRRLPDIELYDDIIRLLGDRPDGQKLANCRKVWIKRGYNKNSWVWLFEWYADGIPPPTGRASAGNAKQSAIDQRQDMIRRFAQGGTDG